MSAFGCWLNWSTQRGAKNPGWPNMIAVRYRPAGNWRLERFADVIDEFGQALGS
jgi:hypothetical protein